MVVSNMSTVKRSHIVLQRKHVKGIGFLANIPLFPLPGKTTLLLDKLPTCFIHALKIPLLLTRVGQNELLFHNGTTSVQTAFFPE